MKTLECYKYHGIWVVEAGLSGVRIVAGMREWEQGRCRWIENGSRKEGNERKREAVITCVLRHLS